MENSTDGAKPKGLLDCLPDTFHKEDEKIIYFTELPKEATPLKRGALTTTTDTTKSKPGLGVLSNEAIIANRLDQAAMYAQLEYQFFGIGAPFGRAEVMLEILVTSRYRRPIKLTEPYQWEADSKCLHVREQYYVDDMIRQIDRERRIARYIEGEFE